jgi:hypothetical protein
MEIKVKHEDFDALCYFNSLQDRALLEIVKEGKTKIAVQRWLNTIKASKYVAEEILQILMRSKTELQLAVDDPTSDQREGYSYLSKPQLTKYHKFVTDAYEDAQGFLDKAYPKKIRKKKPQDPEKVVKNLKYLEKDETMNLQSVSPKDILGASMLTVYNTKNRVLTLYIAKPEGFSIKGSTLLNWDESKSMSKKLRKPEDTIPTFVSVGYNVVQPRFLGIKTKPTKPNGRINGNMVLLWAKKISQ